MPGLRRALPSQKAFTASVNACRCGAGRARIVGIVGSWVRGSEVLGWGVCSSLLHADAPSAAGAGREYKGAGGLREGVRWLARGHHLLHDSGLLSAGHDALQGTHPNPHRPWTLKTGACSLASSLTPLSRTHLAVLAYKGLATPLTRPQEGRLVGALAHHLPQGRIPHQHDGGHLCS